MIKKNKMDFKIVPVLKLGFVRHDNWYYPLRFCPFFLKASKNFLCLGMLVYIILDCCTQKLKDWKLTFIEFEIFTI